MNIRAFANEMLSYAERAGTDNELAGEDLARTLKQLTELEVEEGGPYAIDTEPDLATNLAIACFLAAHDVRLPKLDAYIASAGRGRTPLELQLQNHLIKYRKKARSAGSAPTLSEEALGMFARIRSVADKRFTFLSEEMHAHASAVIQRTIAGNPDTQMSLMAYHVRTALGSKGAHFDDDYIAELGFANICFWTAFIVYDDFWDEDEAAEPRLLPSANLFARHYTDFFTHLLPETSGFRTFFHETMDALDAANTWEMLYCRMRSEGDIRVLPKDLPAYGEDFAIKFYPAAGHIFGPVAMLLQLGHGIGARETRQLIAYFRHYLIAMQLNDDAHDWREDLERGHLSTAVTVLLQKWRAKYPGHDQIDVVLDMPQLEELFWFEVLAPLSECVLSHTRRSRDALAALSVIEDAQPLEHFIAVNERVALQALKEQASSEAFVRVFT